MVPPNLGNGAGGASLNTTRRRELMKVKLFKREDGLVDVQVRKTLPAENLSRGVLGVKPEDVEAVVEKLVGEMRPQEPF